MTGAFISFATKVKQEIVPPKETKEVPRSFFQNCLRYTKRVLAERKGGKS